MVTKFVEVEVEVDLADFETDELIEELESRDEMIDMKYNIDSIVESIYNLKRNNRSYDKEVSDLIYNVLGRIC